MDAAMLNNRKRRPTHPGELLREELLPATGLTQSELARMMGISRRALIELCQERRGVTADLAHRLAIVFGTTPDVWIDMQSAVDI
ncbi:MAG TPA: HigA family addiction module antitoxin [Blastocatellia bacterium]|jgi:addiction module HigA family antidote